MILREIVGQIIQLALTFIKLEFITRVIFELANTVGLRITSSIDAMLNRKEIREKKDGGKTSRPNQK